MYVHILNNNAVICASKASLFYVESKVTFNMYMYDVQRGIIPRKVQNSSLVEMIASNVEEPFSFGVFLPEPTPEEYFLQLLRPILKGSSPVKTWQCSSPLLD